ncbi:pYEATS domain-containing protein [Geobacter sulfurreducens]|uniref:pYEATS domain-containing protein n=1 Tax=Geobacter sulfurreducens TaxID=35554 RepID=UPI002BE71D10|nr:pYEATS domain-containing protein [Geobacter sulfurreducens]HML79088.1 hypothetical protein [Geobacter sulfurreducens]
MNNPIKEFGTVAQGLAKNPLGIIALFIVLIYGFACLVVGASSHLQAGERTPIIWFMVLFPVVVLAVFSWLVSCHHKKLYAPSDFKNEEHFLEAIKPELHSLSYASPVTKDSSEPVLLSSTGDDWETTRMSVYDNNKCYFIAHVLEPSKRDGQEYDIFIYLIKHKSTDYSEVEKAEFFFGHYWGNKIYVGSKMGDLIGVKTSAYGPFLALCRVTFKDGSTVMLNKYIDFEMGFAVKKYLAGR